jgi:NAD(P)-dependent dehydrogenase (short-subunit alcohol dehydrogenase family)
MDVKGKVTIITGASMGIGLSTARLFAAQGARLALVARSSDKLKALAEDLSRQGQEVLAVTADMTNPTAVKQMVDAVYNHFGQLDILINNAGQAAAGTVAEVDLDDFRKIIDLNVLGPMLAIQAAIPKMRLHNGGLIINISSMVSKMHIPGLGAYASTKSALNMLSDTARGELVGENIRVITVYPRLTSTDFGRNSLGNRQMRDHQRGSAPSTMQADTPEWVAGKILLAAQKEPEEQFMD